MGALAPDKQKAISKRKGREVAKDLMIWPRPQMTTWNSEGRSQNVPGVILEWKFGRVSPFEGDVRWLEEYSKEHRKFVGYAVSLHRGKSATFSVRVTRVESGVRELDWLVHSGRPAP